MWGEIDTEVNLALLLVLLNKLFVVHGQLLLILLQADVDVVDKHLAVSDSRLRLDLWLGALRLLAFLTGRLDSMLACRSKSNDVDKASLRKQLLHFREELPLEGLLVAGTWG